MAAHPLHSQNKEIQVIVVMVPFPAQGHLNQLLHLSRLISSYGIPVHYVGTTTHSRQAKLRVHGWDLLSAANIHFHEIPTPPFLSPLPNPNDPNHFPSHLQPSFDATLRLREPVAELLLALAPTAQKVVVIHDYLMGSVVQDIVSIPNGEAYCFQSVSTFLISSYIWGIVGKPIGLEEEIRKEFPPSGSTTSREILEFSRAQSVHQKFSSGTLYNTCREIEGPFLDVLAKVKPKQWAIGPFNPVEICRNSNGNKCLEWLDHQAPNSVIFVCFGTTSSFTDEQVHEIGIGLENSGQKFIWVLRDADKGDIFVGGPGDVRRSELPNGYEERIQGRGIIVRDWAPQLEILGHASTGGFMSHCGWNSSLESITMGVPIATWPMHSDQPHNALLLTKVLKIGVGVKDWRRRDELVESATVEKAVRRLMGTKEGEDIRRRAAELGDAVKRSVAEGGVSRIQLDDFIAHMTSVDRRTL